MSPIRGKVKANTPFFLFHVPRGFRSQNPLQVLLFVFPPHSRIVRVASLLAAVQKRDGLSDISLYRTGTGISVICQRTFPVRRPEKMIRAAGTTNFGTLVKYRQLFFRIGEVRDENQKVLAGAPEFVWTLTAPEKNNVRFVSRPITIS
ncbi:MAG: hypothetical protein WCB46_09240 [Methanoregula sp.]